MEERIKNIYNDCWKNYKTYLSDHDMAAYNVRSQELTEKYECREDIIDLLLWFAPKVQTLHDMWRRSNGEHVG